MTRVLFVDDDTRVLSGLRRQLHDRREAWEMVFAPGGPEALALVGAETFDAVVTDMKMPVIDGAKVLVQVVERQPSALRIVLSGEADPERRVDAASCAHRYLVKPCAPETLKLEIEQGLAMRARVEALQDARLVSLWRRPPFSTAGGRDLLAAMQSEATQLPQGLAESLDADDTLWRRVRQALSAAWVDEVTLRSTPDELASAVGARTVLGTAMAARVLELVDLGDGGGWTSALPVAVSARKLAREHGLPGDAAAEAFLGGLLHAVCAGESRDDTWAVLAYVLPCWGFPRRVVDAATACPDAWATCGEGHPLAAVLAARLLVGDSRAPELVAALSELGWSERVSAWKHIDRN
ncbi:MAG: response regulator [Planctomycetes bacterium]|nr:response regulator [Planctomycetota bacterium]